MRLRKVTLLLLCVLVIGAMAPASGFAAFYNSKSTSADAWWSSWNPESGEPGPGVAIEDWNVSGNTGSGIFKDAGVPLDVFKGSMGWASKFSYTPAAGGAPAVWTEFNCFTESPSVLTFGKSLGSARLEYLAEGTVNVWRGSEPWVEVGPDEWELREPDETSTEMVSVMASWKATGPRHQVHVGEPRALERIPLVGPLEPELPQGHGGCVGGRCGRDCVPEWHVRRRADQRPEVQRPPEGSDALLALRHGETTQACNRGLIRGAPVLHSCGLSVLTVGLLSRA